MKDLFTSFAATVLILLLTVIQGILSARWLLPQGKGELTAVMLWPTMLVAVGSLGLGDAMAFHTTQTAGTDGRRLSAAALWIALTLSGVLVGAGYLILPVVLGRYDPSIIQTSKLFLWYIPPTLVTTGCLAGVLLGKLKLLQYNILRVSVYVTSLSVMIAFYLLGQVSVRNFVVAFLASSWGALMVAVFFVVARGWIGWRFTFETIASMKKLLTYGVKVHIGSLAGMLNLRLDQLLLSAFLPPSILGLYVVAVSVGSGAGLVASAIAFVAFPRLSNLPSGAGRAQALGRFMRLNLMATAVVAGTLFLGAPWIIRFFFGAAYAESVGLARILILAALPLGSNAILAAGLKAHNLPAVSSRAEVLGLVVTALALLGLLPTFQAVGAAWASLLAYSATFIYMTGQTRRQMNVRLAELFLPGWSDWNYLKDLVARVRLAQTKALK